MKRMYINIGLLFIINTLVFSGIAAQKDSLADWMFIDDEKINTFTTGAYNVIRNNELLHFDRFPDTVLSLFDKKKTWDLRSHCTSGIKISFQTDSEFLLFSGISFPESPQNEPFIVICDGNPVARLPRAFDTGVFNQTIELAGTGQKLVEIYFPAYAKGAVKQIAVEKNAIVKHLPPRGILLAMGNSITQAGGGYKGYADILATNMELNLHNSGVGGHIFDASKLAFAYIAKPEIITVAYGTNDWNGGRPIINIEDFFERLDHLYPETRIIVLEPIHRYSPSGSICGKPARNKNGKSLNYYREEIRRIVKSYPNMKVIYYENIIDDDPGLFSDGIHPNSTGHMLMGENLTAEIKDVPDSTK